MANLLEVRNLATYFFQEDSTVKAVDDISFDLEAGETLALVGESGCGKSISALSIMKLVPDPPGKIVSGEVLFNGEDLGGFNEQQMRQVRGKEIAMIFQEPMTSLNPVLTIGRQLTEALELHLGMSGSPKRMAGPWSSWTWWASPTAPSGSRAIRTSSAAACASGS